MSCTLNKFKSYDVGQIHHNNSTGVYNVSIINPGASCSDNAFNGKKVEVVVKDGVAPTLTYNVADNKPVITVPSNGYIIEYGSSFGFFDFVWLLLIVGIMAFIGRKIYLNMKKDKKPNEANSAQSSPSSSDFYVIPKDRASGFSGAPYLVSSPHPASGGYAQSNPGAIIGGVIGGVLSAEFLNNIHASSGDVYNTTNNYSDNTSKDYVLDAPSDNSFSSDASSDNSFSSDASSDNDYSSEASSDNNYTSDSSSDDSFSSDSDSGEDSYSSDSGGD